MSVNSVGQSQVQFWSPHQIEDPFCQIIARPDNFLGIDRLIQILNANREGTFFLRSHVFVNNYNEADKEKFLQIYEKIPDSLKYPYLTIRDQYGNTIIHHLATRVEIDFIKKIFSSLTDLERFKCLCFGNDIGRTPLHWAVDNTNLIIADSLINFIVGNDLKTECYAIIGNESSF
ncbi:MAG: hypothetical protein K1060chlam1_01228 [Candidatus Anoxychlamydiales bacterium]|nr:hypothetical protein [Candidatus Anoxychlamydiales bacterium]